MVPPLHQWPSSRSASATTHRARKLSSIRVQRMARPPGNHQGTQGRSEAGLVVWLVLGGHSWLVLMVLECFGWWTQSFFERKRTEVRWDDLPSCQGRGVEDGFNHQSVAPGWCKLGQGDWYLVVPKSMGWMGQHGKTYLCHQRGSGFLQLLLPPSDGNSRTLATVTVCTSSWCCSTACLVRSAAAKWGSCHSCTLDIACPYKNSSAQCEMIWNACDSWLCNFGNSWNHYLLPPQIEGYLFTLLSWLVKPTARTVQNWSMLAFWSTHLKMSTLEYCSRISAMYIYIYKCTGIHLLPKMPRLFWKPRTSEVRWYNFFMSLDKDQDSPALIWLFP